MDTRNLKALVIAATRLIRPADGGGWIVPSETTKEEYRVVPTLNGVTCSCPDWATRRQDCKHIIAARYRAAQQGLAIAPTIDPAETEVVPTRKKYPRDWSAYNKASATEKHRFRILLADLVKNVKQPHYQRGRPPIPLADAIYACVYKVYAGTSSRRHGSDIEDAAEAGFLGKPMHYNKVNAFLEKEYLTEHLRKLIELTSLPFIARANASNFHCIMNFCEDSFEKTDV